MDAHKWNRSRKTCPGCIYIKFTLVLASGEGNGNPLQYSFPWRIPLDRGAWWATVHGVTKSWTRLNN